MVRVALVCAKERSSLRSADFELKCLGGHHFVWALEGQLSEEITFEPSNLVGVLKVLKTYQGKETSLDLTPSEKAFMIRCGSSKLTISRKI